MFLNFIGEGGEAGLCFALLISHFNFVVFRIKT